MIYITGDTHGDISRFEDWAEGHKLTKKDYLIVAGDFGFIFSNNKFNIREIENLRHIEKYPWTTLFIDGNHENFHRLFNDFPNKNMFDGVVTEIHPSIFMLKRGQIYNIDGKKVFTFGGGDSIDKLDRIQDVTWWKEELPTYEECMQGIINLGSVDNKVDYMITHTAPEAIAQRVLDQIGEGLVSNENCLRKYLTLLSEKVQFKRWYFAHFHMDVKYDKYIGLYEQIREMV